MASMLLKYMNWTNQRSVRELSLFPTGLSNILESQAIYMKSIHILRQQRHYWRFQDTDRSQRSFRKRGGKLIIYSGWSDAAVPGMAVVGYYEDVLAYDKTGTEDVRLFMP